MIQGRSCFSCSLRCSIPSCRSWVYLESGHDFSAGWEIATNSFLLLASLRGWSSLKVNFLSSLSEWGLRIHVIPVLPLFLLLSSLLCKWIFKMRKQKKSLGLCSESTFVFISLPYSRYMALVNTRWCVNVLQMFCSSLILSLFCRFQRPASSCWSVSSFLVEGTRSSLLTRREAIFAY